jgi:hypothetical protein
MKSLVKMRIKVISKAQKITKTKRKKKKKKRKKKNLK